MKTLSNSKNSIFHSLKNFWFGLQLLIVSVSFPAMSFFQVWHSGSVTKSQPANQVSNDQVNQSETARQEQLPKTAMLRS